MRKLDNKSCEGLRLRVVNDRFTRKLEKPVGKTPDFFSVVYESKDMKFCTQVPKTCVHKRFILDFHLFA